MKTTGVSRRIDDLGRIVIPKEIRKNLKIRDGELLEILVDGEQIILTKHSSMKSISDIANLCIDAVNDTLNVDLIITDRDKVIASTPQLRKKYVDKDLCVEFVEEILKHNPVFQKEPKTLKIDNENEEQTTYVSYPIVVDGDVAGTVMVLGLNNKISEIDEKVASLVSKFLKNNIS